MSTSTTLTTMSSVRKISDKPDALMITQQDIDNDIKYQANLIREYMKEPVNGVTESTSFFAGGKLLTRSVNSTTDINSEAFIANDFVTLSRAAARTNVNLPSDAPASHWYYSKVPKATLRTNMNTNLIVLCSQSYEVNNTSTKKITIYARSYDSNGKEFFLMPVCVHPGATITLI